MKKRHIIIFALWGIGTHLHAQNCILTTGGNSISTDGSISYSIGQIIVSSINDDSHKLLHGIQQSITENIFTSTKIKENNNTSHITIFTIPSESKSIIRLSAYKENLSYNMYNINGVLVQSDDITEINTEIHIESGFYMLTIIEDKKIILRSQMIKL